MASKQLPLTIISDPVYDLVHSMSRMEKRYFNINTQSIKNNKGKVPDYYILFEILDKMKIYDKDKAEQKLLQKLGKEKFSNFTVKKIELYDVLMKSLRNYSYKQTKKSADYIKILIRDANFLFKRGLYKDAKRHLNDARKLAEKCGDTLSLIEINRFEREYLRMNRSLDMEERLPILHEEEEKLIDDLKMESELICNYDLLTNQRIKNTSLVGKESIDQFKSDYKHLHKIDPNSISKIAQRFLWSCLCDYYFLLRENTAMVNVRQLHFEWWKNNELWRKQYPHYYIISLSNLLGTYSRVKDYDKFPEIINAIEKIEPNNQHESAVRFHRLMVYHQIYFMNKGLLNEACNLSKRIEKGIKNHKLNEGVQIALIFNTIVAFFINERYKECIEWINFFKPFEKIERGKQQVQFVQILKVISFFELDDFDEIEHAVKSIKRYFIDFFKMSETDFELIILELLKEFYEAIPSRRKQILEKIKHDIKLIQSTPETKRQIGMEELTLWVEYKLTGKSMISLLKK